MKNFAPLPVGKEDFEDLITSQSYAVDKTILIKELINSHNKVSLITRPRRFGKTLALSMLKYFFEKPLDGKDKRHLFNNTKIANTEYIEEYQGRYPVIFLTLKSIKENSWLEMRQQLSQIIANECLRHDYLLASDKIKESQKEMLEKLISSSADDNLLRNSLKLLSNCLEAYHNEKVIILIDEYDTPLTAAFVKTENDKVQAKIQVAEFQERRIRANNEKLTLEDLSKKITSIDKEEQEFNTEYKLQAKFYDEIRNFIRFWFSEALKTNTSLKFAVLTGITRLVNESIFSELNNLRVSTIFDDEYTEFFGFTKPEMDKIYQDFELTPEEKQGMQDWYDGYKIYETEIYNPWSVINALQSKCRFTSFWSNTSSNAIVPVLFTGTTQQSRNDILSAINSLLNGESYDCNIKAHTGFYTLYDDTDNFFCYLANTGYLTIKEIIDPLHCNLVIPNKEVFYTFPEAIQKQLKADYSADLASVKKFTKALTQGNPELLSESINNFIFPTMSFFDTQEDFYHGIMLGLSFALAENYIIKSNRESGYGRFDLMLKHKHDRNAAGIIIECKRINKDEKLEERMNREELHDFLRAEAQKALAQVKNKHYESELHSEGIEQIYKYAVIFYKKEAEVVLEID